MDVAALAHEAESAELPAGDGERFAGYGVMGLPFASGHVLAMRRFPASSIGSGYTSVWHRTPSGDWTFFQDQPAEHGCGRYFSAAVSTLTETEIVLEWPRPDELHITIPSVEFDWRLRMAATPRSRVFTMIGSVLPERAWRSPRLLSAVGPIAGGLLGVGRVGLAGRAPNGQSFVANPQLIWFVAESAATLAGTDFGPPGRLATQARLGDFALPQQGLFAVGRAFFN